MENAQPQPKPNKDELEKMIEGFEFDPESVLDKTPKEKAIEFVTELRDNAQMNHPGTGIVSDLQNILDRLQNPTSEITNKEISEAREKAKAIASSIVDTTQ